MFKIYLVIYFVFNLNLVASQNIECFAQGKVEIIDNCSENNKLQNRYSKKGFLNPYTTEIRFNHIVVDEDNNKHHN
jgi:hypothetical protein